MDKNSSVTKTMSDCAFPMFQASGRVLERVLNPLFYLILDEKKAVSPLSGLEH